MMRNILRLVALALGSVLVVSSPVSACSSFSLEAEDGTRICTRTMEFGLDTQSSLVVVPRGWAFTSPAPGGKTGLVWKARFGFVACNAFGLQTSAVDGLNEKGLVFSALWYEGDTQWPVVPEGEEALALAHADIGSWVLSNFETVEEVKAALADIRLFGYSLPQLGGAPPLHFIVYDAKGGCIVIECDQGELHVYDNDLGLITNAPNFPWMRTNLRNYIGMTNERTPSGTICGVTFNGTGHGTGMYHLPGDLTPPSRFVRLALHKQFAEAQPDAATTLNLAQHIANTVDIVAGMIVDKDASGRIVSQETTEWTTFYDQTHQIAYFRTYSNLNLRKVDLARLDFAADHLRFISMDQGPESTIDLSLVP